MQIIIKYGAIKTAIIFGLAAMQVASPVVSLTCTSGNTIRHNAILFIKYKQVLMMFRKYKILHLIKLHRALPQLAVWYILVEGAGTVLLP